MPSPYGRQILVVENEADDRQEVRAHLERNGFTVLQAENGHKAIEVLTRTIPDLALIDINLQDMSGFEVARTLKRYADVPIIFITVETHEDTKVMALEQYAEDYMTKPISLREMTARINRILRRFSGPSTDTHAEIIVDDHLHINFSQHWIEVKQSSGEYARESLTPIESRILYILVHNPCRVMTTEALLSRVWANGEEAFPEGLRVHVRRLRMKIEPDPSNPTYIVTERGLGYRFAVPIKGQALSNA